MIIEKTDNFHTLTSTLTPERKIYCIKDQMLTGMTTAILAAKVNDYQFYTHPQLHIDVPSF